MCEQSTPANTKKRLVLRKQEAPPPQRSHSTEDININTWVALRWFRSSYKSSRGGRERKTRCKFSVLLCSNISAAGFVSGGRAASDLDHLLLTNSRLQRRTVQTIYGTWSREKSISCLFSPHSICISSQRYRVSPVWSKEIRLLNQAFDSWLSHKAVRVRNRLLSQPPKNS